MTKGEKELLLKDLCARLPYGVMIQRPELFYPSKMVVEKLVGIDEGRINDSGVPVECVKPYLRPRTSMTEEEKMELKNLCDITPYETQGITVDEYGIGIFLNDRCSVNYEVIDWFHSHYINYRLPDDLCIEAPEGMY